MSLRLKLVLALVALSAAATVAIGAISYRTTAQQLRDGLVRPQRHPHGHGVEEHAHHRLDARHLRRPSGDGDNASSQSPPK